MKTHTTFALLLSLSLPACSFAEPEALEDESGDESGFTSTGGDATPLPTTTTRGMLDLDSSGSSEGSSGSSEGSSEGSSGSSGAAETGSGGSDSSETEAPADSPYGDCYDGPAVPENQLCAGSCAVSDEGDFSACAPDCRDSACEAPGVCFSEILPPDVGTLAPVCVISCDEESCPEGMECKQMTYGGYLWDLCMWE